jgi:hypothetical protein
MILTLAKRVFDNGLGSLLLRGEPGASAPGKLSSATGTSLRGLTPPARVARWARLARWTRHSFTKFVNEPASARPLAALRIGVAAVLLWQAFSLSGHLLDLFSDRGVVQWSILPFQPPRELPSIHAVAELLAPLKVTPDSAVRLVFFSYVASLVLLLLGFQTRLAAVVAWLTHMAIKTTGSTSIYGVDDFAHIALFYCVWLPVGAAWSLDRQGKSSEEATPLARLGLRLLQLHLCIVYLSSGIEKATGEQWWNGEAMWRTLMRQDLGMIDASWLAQMPWLAATLCIGTLVVEIGYALMIWHRRTRPLWAAATIGLHAGIAVFMGLLTFGALMIVLNVAALVVPAAVPEGKGVRELPEKVGAKRAGAM